MQKLWQQKLKLIYSKDVFDIVQFGSSVMAGKIPNDVDIAVIFNKIPLKNQLEQAQKIKKQLQKFSELSIHIKSYDLYSLFDKSNFAKESIIFYGISLISKDYFSKKMGFTPKVQIDYSLINLEKKDKVKFNYLISGKNKKYGLIKKYGGQLVKPGLIEISPEFENIFVDNIKRITSKFKIEKILKI